MDPRGAHGASWIELRGTRIRIQDESRMHQIRIHDGAKLDPKGDPGRVQDIPVVDLGTTRDESKIGGFKTDPR